MLIGHILEATVINFFEGSMINFERLTSRIFSDSFNWLVLSERLISYAVSYLLLHTGEVVR